MLSSVDSLSLSILSSCSMATAVLLWVFGMLALVLVLLFMGTGSV